MKSFYRQEWWQVTPVERSEQVDTFRYVFVGQLSRLSNVGGERGSDEEAWERGATNLGLGCSTCYLLESSRESLLEADTGQSWSHGKKDDVCIDQSIAESTYSGKKEAVDR